VDARIRDALGRQPGVDDWTIRREASRGVQLYLVGDRIENVRHVQHEAYEVDLFNRHQTDAGAAVGSATLPVASSDLDRLGPLLADGVTIAASVHSPPWELPGAGDNPDVPLADPQLLSPDGAMRVAEEFADRIRELIAQHDGRVRLSAAELFLTASEEELENSRGASGTTVSTHVLLEINLLSGAGNQEAEAFRQVAARRLEDLNIENTIESLARGAQDMIHAGPPRTHLGPVIVGGDAIWQLLGAGVTGGPGAILTQASAASAYDNISRLEVGRPISGEREPAGDPITVRANARLPYGLTSYRLDPDGVPAQDLLIVEDGILVARPATKRYADYLGLPTTGYASQIQVAAGNRTAASLLEDDGHRCEVLAFSAANVDALTGNFGMEIRVGYDHGPDGTRRPVKGGSVTGNLFEALADARFSAETGLFPAYQGPVAARFGRLQVSGGD
jgi:predicted Zn-dependent protease